MLRRVGAFVVATAVMILLGSSIQSYLIQRDWSAAAGLADGTASVGIPFTDRISWIAHDWVGMFVPYSIVIIIALLIAFLVAGAVARFTGFRNVVFALAGAAALFTLYTTLRIELGTVGFFGARGPIGFAGQMAVGAIAGLLFARLTQPRNIAIVSTAR
jgi:hypothetical protein